MSNRFNKLIETASKQMERQTPHKVVDVVSDALSAPARLRSAAIQKKSGQDAVRIKEARAYDNAPNIENGAVTDAFKARSLATQAKEDTLRRSKKLSK